MKLNKIISGLLAVLLFASCEPDPPEVNEFETKVCNGTVNAGGLNTAGFQVVSLLEETPLNGGNFTIETMDSGTPQLLMVTNANDEVVMLYRGIIPDNGNVEINALSTALASLTFHPALASVNGSDYQEMIDLFTSKPSFDNFLSAIENSIAQNRAIYDTTNTELMNAAQAFFEDLVVDTTSFGFKSATNQKSNSRLTDIFDCWPIDVNEDGKTLKFRMPGLFPTYTCQVYDEENNQERIFVVPTRGNYGLWDAGLCFFGQGDFVYGEEAVYTFNEGNNKTFVFKRLGFDLFLQLTGCIFQMIGAKLETGIATSVAISIEGALMRNGISLVNPGDNWETLLNAALPIALDATVEVLKNHFKEPTKIFNFASLAKKALIWINVAEGGVNFMGRIYSYLKCRETITFCAQMYGDDYTYFDKCGATETWSAGIRCDWANTYLCTFTLDLPLEGDYQIPNTTVSAYDYDGTELKITYSGSYDGLELNLTKSTYKAEDNSLVRTDVFRVWLLDDTTSVVGNATFNGSAGCPNVLDLKRIDNESKSSGILLKKVTNKHSRTNQCTTIGH